MTSEEITAQVGAKLKSLNGLFQNFETRLTSASRATQQVTNAVTAASRAVQAVATLLAFDEINRLKEKSTGSSSSSGSKKSSSDKEKVKTGPTEDYGIDFRLDRPTKNDGLKFWSQFKVGFQNADVGGEEAGGNLIQRIGKGISNALGNVANWVSEDVYKRQALRSGERKTALRCGAGTGRTTTTCLEVMTSPATPPSRASPWRGCCWTRWP